MPNYNKINKAFDKFKYTILLVLVLFYYLITNVYYTQPMDEIKLMHYKIDATYDLIDNLDNFRKVQMDYNQEIIYYLININKLLLEFEQDSLKQPTKEQINTLVKIQNKLNNFLDKNNVENEK